MTAVPSTVSAVRWTYADLAARRRLADVAKATERIADLISSVKAYSNLDRTPTTRPTDANEGVRATLALLELEVRSEGIALEAELDPKLPHVRAGIRLGLDIVRRIVRGHGGEVHVEAVPGRTCFEVRFSATPPDAPHSRG